MRMLKRAREFARGCGLYKVYKRAQLFSSTENWRHRYLLPGRVWLDKLDVVITTKCNLLCKGCSHLIPYYREPGDLDRELVLASMRKLNECFDWCNHYSVLGGEPFLNPDLKFFLEEVPSEKCNRPQVVTNATILPDDPELFAVMRRKRIVVAYTDYPGNRERIGALLALLEREGVAYCAMHPQWTDFGAPVDYQRSAGELKRQFIRCGSRAMSLLNGRLYYCFRSAHCRNLGITAREDGCVDLLNNSSAQNRREIRRLICRRTPLEACRYCKRGTEQNVVIRRGE